MIQRFVIFFFFVSILSKGASAIENYSDTVKEKIDYGVIIDSFKLKGAVWILSVGINDYKSKFNIIFHNCESDARRFALFFEDQYKKKKGSATGNDIHTILLTGEYA